MIGDAWCVGARWCPDSWRSADDNSEDREFVEDQTREHWQQIYVLCVWQAASALFGGATAETTSERSFFIMSTMIGSVMQAFVFGGISHVLKGANREYNLHTRVCTRVLESMKVASSRVGVVESVCSSP